MNFLTILSIFLIVSFQLSPLVLADASLLDFGNLIDFETTTHAPTSSQKSTTHAPISSRKTTKQASTKSQRTSSKLSVSTTSPYEHNNGYNDFGKRDLVENVQHVFRKLVREMKVFVHKINFLEKEFERIYQKEFENRTTGHVNATTGPNLTKHFNTTDLRNLMFNKRNLVSKKLGQVKKITKQTTEQSNAKQSNAEHSKTHSKTKPSKAAQSKATQSKAKQ